MPSQKIAVILSHRVNFATYDFHLGCSSSLKGNMGKDVPLNLTKFSFFRKILSLFPLKTICTRVNFADKWYNLFKFLNTSNFFIKFRKQLVNQQRIGTHMLYASSEIKLATLALNSVLEARTNVTK